MSSSSSAGSGQQRSGGTSAPTAHHRIVSQMDAVGQVDGSRVGGGGIGGGGGGSGAAQRDLKKVTPPPSPPVPAGGEDGTVEVEVAQRQQPASHPEADAAKMCDADASGDHADHHGDGLLHDVAVDGPQPQHRPDGKKPDEEVDRMLGISNDDDAKEEDGTAADGFDENGGGDSAPDRTAPAHTFDIEIGPEDQSPSSKKSSAAARCCPCLPPPYRIGNTTVLFPAVYARTNGKWGVIGPHWPGLLFTFALLYGASYYYIHRSFAIGAASGLVSVAMTTLCTLALCSVAFTDPGVITPDGQRQEHGDGVGGQYAGLPTDGRDLSDWRYCDLCSVYQPPDAAHCPDCDVCIEGFDHHCPWMGTCIGKRNMKAFVTFNLSWMAYLIYALAWVTIGHAGLLVGPGGGPHGDAAAHGQLNATR